MLLLEKTLFWDFPFVVMSRSFREQSRQFVVWTIRLVIFFPFLFLSLFVFFCTFFFGKTVVDYCWLLSFLFLMKFLINASTQFSMLATPLSSFLDMYNLSILSLVIIFIVRWSIYLIFSFVHFKNGPEYFTRRTVYPFDEISVRMETDTTST